MFWTQIDGVIMCVGERPELNTTCEQDGGKLLLQNVEGGNNGCVYDKITNKKKCTLKGGVLSKIDTAKRKVCVVTEESCKTACETTNKWSSEKLICSPGVAGDKKSCHCQGGKWKARDEDCIYK
jgi:hypothetical protein